MRVRFGKRSTHLYAADWNNHNLDVTFKIKHEVDTPGDTYRYFGVPESIFKLLISAEHPGHYLNTWVKQVGYKFVKLEEHVPPPSTAEELEVIMERDKNDLIAFMERKGLIRREMDEQGAERIIVTGDLAQEMIHSFVSLPERFQKNKTVVKNLVEVILKQNLNHNLRLFPNAFTEYAKEKSK